MQYMIVALSGAVPVTALTAVQCRAGPCLVPPGGFRGLSRSERGLKGTGSRIGIVGTVAVARSPSYPVAIGYQSRTTCSS